jgi:hypothetical protein
MKRLGVSLAATVLCTAAITGVSAATASATPTFCNGNYLCANVPAQTITDLFIKMWAPTDGFTGHFQLQSPTGHSYNSANQRYNAGLANGALFDVPIVYGTYCATAWGGSGSSFTKLGYLCFVAGA